MEFLVKKEIKDEDIMIQFLFRNPVLFFEFLDFVDRYFEGEVETPEKTFKHFWYQEDILCDFNPYVSVRASRSCGKTVTLRSKILWILLNAAYGKESILLTTPNKVHLKPLWTEIVRILRANPLASKFVAKTKGINASDFEISLFNGARLICRIAGVEGGERNVVGLHVPFIAIDEAGLYPYDTYQALQPVLNRHQKGHQLLLVGVPTGEKDGNVLWEADVKSEIFSKHRINAFMNPLYDQDAHQEDLKKYGGKDSPDYIHYVLGEHGTSSYSLFTREEMVISNYPVYKLTINFRTGKETEDTALQKVRNFPEMADKYDRVLIGIDLGYTEPTAIYIIKEKNSRFYIHGKLRFIRVPYPVQKRLILELINKFSPDFVAVDAGGVGQSFYQELLEASPKTNFVPVVFQQAIVVGETVDGKEMKQVVKEIAVNYLQKMVTDGDIIFSTTDPDTISDLERFSYTKTPSGKIVYYMSGQSKNKQDDHFVSALLCVSYALFIGEKSYNPHSKKSIKSLFGVKWL